MITRTAKIAMASHMMSSSEILRLANVYNRGLSLIQPLPELLCPHTLRRSFKEFRFHRERAGSLPALTRLAENRPTEEYFGGGTPVLAAAFAAVRANTRYEECC